MNRFEDHNWVDESDYDWADEWQASLAEEEDRVQGLRVQLVTIMYQFLCYCAVAASSALGSEIRPKFSTWEQFSEEQWKLTFRFGRENLERVIAAMGLEEHYTVVTGKVKFRISALKGMCIMLARFTLSGGQTNELIGRVIFGHSEAYIRAVHNFFVKLLYCRYKHILICMNKNFLSPQRLKRYAECIVRKGSPLKTNNLIVLLVDGTVRRICRPRSIFGRDIQALFYSGYKKYHAVKYQGLVAPDGIVIIHGAMPGKYHDQRLFSQSKLLAEGKRVLVDHCLYYLRLHPKKRSCQG